MSAETGSAARASAAGRLPLFPLGTVLFPGGLLPLKVFEPRYLDLMSHCLRTGEPFGVVAITEGTEVRQTGRSVVFESIGVLATVVECDAAVPGLLRVRCRGGSRFRSDDAQEMPDGLWSVQATVLADDAPVPPGPEHEEAVALLKRALHLREAQGNPPLPPPWHLDQAGWVANRWCELLPLPLASRQRLLALDDPFKRLTLVQDFLLPARPPAE